MPIQRLDNVIISYVTMLMFDFIANIQKLSVRHPTREKIWQRDCTLVKKP